MSNPHAPKYPDDFGPPYEEDYSISKKQKIMMIAMIGFACLAVYYLYEGNQELKTDNFSFDPNKVYDCKTLSKIENSTMAISGFGNTTRLLDSIHQEQNRMSCKK